MKANDEAYDKFLEGWTLRREKVSCTNWLGRETELGKMFNRLGRVKKDNDGHVLKSEESVVSR